MILPQQITEWRNRLGFSQDLVARYFGWSLNTIIGYENGMAIPEKHARLLAKAMNLEIDTFDHKEYRTLARTYASNGEAYLSEIDLTDAYLQISSNPKYDPLFRGACQTRLDTLRQFHQRRIEPYGESQ